MLVWQVFFEHEVYSILAIPFSPSLPPNTRVWTFTSLGRFSVASTYWVALTAKVKAQNNGISGVNLDPQQMHSFWKLFWKLKVPNKIRSFIWRACKDILPVKSNLALSVYYQGEHFCWIEVEVPRIFWALHKWKCPDFLELGILSRRTFVKLVG